MEAAQSFAHPRVILTAAQTNDACCAAGYCANWRAGPAVVLTAYRSLLQLLC